jgi:hypothetical protein
MFADRLRKVFETGDRAAIEDLYAEDALLDANVPLWRFQRKGIAEIASQYEEWLHAGTFTIIGIREWPAPWGSVVENDQEEPDGNGDTVYSRQLHLLVADGDKVVQHIMYCTGLWDAETVAKQKSEAPIYDA